MCWTRHFLLYSLPAFYTNTHLAIKTTQTQAIWISIYEHLIWSDLISRNKANQMKSEWKYCITIFMFPSNSVNKIVFMCVYVWEEIVKWNTKWQWCESDISRPFSDDHWDAIFVTHLMSWQCMELQTKDPGHCYYGGCLWKTYGHPFTSTWKRYSTQMFPFNEMYVWLMMGYCNHSCVRQRRHKPIIIDRSNKWTTKNNFNNNNEENKGLNRSLPLHITGNERMRLCTRTITGEPILFYLWLSLI